MAADNMIKAEPRGNGFTLVEMALVLLILGVLTKAAIMPLVAVQTHRQTQITARQLEIIRESVIAYVVAYGALPCPVLFANRSSATASPLIYRQESSGAEPSECEYERGGVPAKILGLLGAVGENGALIDAWNQPYLYAVSLANHTERGDKSRADWTHAGEAAQVGVPNLSADIVICMEMQANDCSGRDVRANQVAFMVLSHGRDSTAAGAQKENLDDDQVFLLQPESQIESNRFDDQLVWATAADIMYWMLRMGWLP